MCGTLSFILSFFAFMRDSKTPWHTGGKERVIKYFFVPNLDLSADRAGGIPALFVTSCVV